MHRRMERNINDLSFSLDDMPKIDLSECNVGMNLKTPQPYWQYSRGYKRRTQALENKFAAVTSRAVSSECVRPCSQRFPLKHIVREVAGSGCGNDGGGNLQPQRRAAGNLCSLSAAVSGTLLAARGWRRQGSTLHKDAFLTI